MKKGKLFLTATMCCTMLLSVGCGKKNSTDYSKYVDLGEYKGIEVTLASTEVTNDEVKNTINRTLENNQTEEEVTDRAVKDGDIVNIDYVGTMDGEEFEGGKDTGFDLTIGSKSFIDDFEEQLIGHKIGDDVTVEVTFPENYQQEDLAGKDAEFAVKINGIKEMVTPELTDAWITEYTKEDETPYTNVADYKKSVRDELVAQKIENANNKKTADVLTKIVENSKINGYPEDQIDAYVNSNLEYYESFAAQFGTTLDGLLAQMGQTRQQFEEQTKKDGEAIIARQMICMLIADKENITISDEEYQTGLKNYAEKYSSESNPYTPESFEKAYGKDVVEENLLIEKVLKFITDNAVEVEAQEK